MGLRGRPPKSSRVLEINGSFAHNPSRKRARANEPPSTGRCFDHPPPTEFLIPEPESGYLQAARCLAQWKQLALEGPLIDFSSRSTVIHLAIAQAEVLRSPAGSKTQQGWIKQSNELRVQLGLTEVSRPKVNAGDRNNTQRGSSLAGLAQERGTQRRA
jgi:hypothetical protein